MKRSNPQMSSSTNDALPLPLMGGLLSNVMHFTLDGFSVDDFIATMLPPPPSLATDLTRLILPSSYNDGNHGHSSSSVQALTVATPVSSEAMTTIVTTNSFSAPTLPSSALSQVQVTSHRTSCYRGVTRHMWMGRYEAHLWDNTCRREGQKRKGRQVYLGGYDKEDKAARAYDLAALKYWGVNANTNFPKESYIREIEEMQNMSRQELVASLRRKSSGFSRGASIYRGVTRHHHHGRWQARIGRVAGNKDLYLGTFATEQEAAEAYDIAALKFRGGNAVTNFEPSRYNLEAIAQSELPISGPERQLNNYKPAAPEAQGQITLASATPFPQQPGTNVPPYLLHNLLQLPSCEPLHALPLPGYSFGESSFYWPFDNVEQKGQLESKMEVAGGLLQLANSAAN